MDPNETTSSSSSCKKRKVQQDGDPSKNKETTTNNNDNNIDNIDNDNTTAETFTKRWMEQDRRRTLRLWNHHQGGSVATYQWDETRMQFATLPGAAGEYDVDDDEEEENNDEETALRNLLIGEYDIIFCYGEPGATDQGWTDGPISRTVSQGILTMACREIPAGDYFYDEGREILYGKIDNVTRTFARDDDGWEGGPLQMDNVEFRRFPNNFFGTGRGPTFCVTKHEGSDCGDEYEARIRILQNSGTLDWIPNEQFLLFEKNNNSNDNSRENEEYAQFLRESIARLQQHRGANNENSPSWWRVEHSWLCRHMGITADTALKICDFMIHRQPVPPPTWAWQPGDLVLHFEMTDYATSWDTTYVARRRQKTATTTETIKET